MTYVDKKVITPDDLGSGITYNPVTQQYEVDLSSYVQKGQNGTWGDTITPATDLREPQPLTYYDNNTNNRPFGNTYGVAISFGGKGHLRKEDESWIFTLAFGTDRKLFVTQSINGGQDTWFGIPTSTRSLHTIRVTGTTPAVGSSVVIPVSGIGRGSIASLNVRIDLSDFSVCLGCPIETVEDGRRVTGLKFTNLTEYNVPQGRSLTIYITYER